MQKRGENIKKDTAMRLREEKAVRKKRKEKEKKIKRFLKFNKVKAIVLTVIVFLSFVFQWFLDPALCLKLICSPVVLGAIYYLFWIVDLINIPLLNILPAFSFIGFIWKAVFYLLQAVYWYVLTCVLTLLVNKARARIWKHIGKRRGREERILKEKLKRDLEKAKQLEEEKIRKIGSKI